MTLHTWNKAEFSHPSFALCRTSMVAGDALLLLEDGAYVTLDTEFNAWLRTSSQEAGFIIHVLVADLAARGISARIPPELTAIDYKEFVALCLQHERVINWTG